MSFFGKFKAGAASAGQNANGAASKKDANAAASTALERHIKDLPGQIRADGSDKFFGFENYGSTCYSNSIIQCLYYSAPFREHVINFPPKDYVQHLPSAGADTNGAPIPPRSTSSIPWPNATSPARKPPPAPGSPAAQGKPEETKDAPEYRKRMALQAGPVLDMVHDNSNRYGMEESLFTALKDIFDAILTNSSRIGVVSPHKFLEILRRENEMFRSAMHQDAHEFLNLLLNEVVENVDAFSKQHPTLNGAQPNGAAPEITQDGPLTSHRSSADTTPTTTTTTSNGLDTRWVHDLFEGLLTSETRCLTCENLSQRDEPFLDLSVDLAAHTSVTSCLRKFSAEEMLCERNKFHCDNCGGLQEAEKRMKIKRLPRVLALHLKRFKYTEDLQRLQKLFHRVVYPFHLRLFNTTDDAADPDRLYELYAVVVHIGGGPYHGHYVSIIKTHDRGWLLFDDELVQPVDQSYVLNFFGGEPVPGLQDARQLACAYVLFYQETTLDAVLREQDAQGEQQQHHLPTKSRTSADVDAHKDAATAASPLSPPMRNGFVPAATSPLASPILEAADGSEGLWHAVTAPNVSSPTATPAPPLEPAQTTPAAVPVVPAVPVAPAPAAAIKSRKEKKAEAKEKKAAAKAAERELEEKRREESKRRVEAWKKQDEELRSAIEASRQTATEEATKRGDEPIGKPAGKEGGGGGGGLSRFRTSSMSLRSKPKFFGGRDKDHSNEKLAPVPQESGEGGEGAQVGKDGAVAVVDEIQSPVSVSTTTPEIRSPEVVQSAEVRTPEVQSPPLRVREVRSPAVEERVRRNRFSLGRKRSQNLV